MYNGKKVSVIIPVFNEERSISQVLKEIPKEVADEVIVVDNNSTDRTGDIARGCGAMVVKETRRGYGSACLRGISSLKDTDIIVIVDGDLSDYPAQMPDIISPIADGKADLVLGSRILGKMESGALTPQAYWGNKLAVFLIKFFFGHKYTDMGPFRAISYEGLMALNMIDLNYGWNAEMQIKAIKKGFSIMEVPVDYRKRIGESKISGTFKGTIYAGAKIIYTIFKYALMKN